MHGAEQLIDQSHYDMNIVNAKIMQATDVNFSDDELTFLPYMSYMQKYDLSQPEVSVFKQGCSLARF
jgi:hypothetical protein